MASSFPLTLASTLQRPVHSINIPVFLPCPAHIHHQLFKADLNVAGSFDEAMAECTLVVHTASPFITTSKHPVEDIIKPVNAPAGAGAPPYAHILAGARPIGPASSTAGAGGHAAREQGPLTLAKDSSSR